MESTTRASQPCRVVDPKPGVSWKAAFCIVGGTILVCWAVLSMRLSCSNVEEVPRRFVTFVARMFPPDVSCLDTVMPATLSTIRISIVGSLLGSIVALPVGLLAARGVGLPWIVSAAIRVLLATVRTVPSLILAILFVSVVGLGELAGCLALAVFSFGVVTKLLYESIEAMAPGPCEAVRSCGGNTFDVFRFALLPQALPHYISASLYAWDINLRGAFVLGMVGAGGLGFELMSYIRLFEMRKVSTILTVLVVLVALADWMSGRLRRMFI